MFALIESGMKMVNVSSKTRSLYQSLEKHFASSRCHILGPILMKLGQNACLDEISDEFEKEVKLGQKLGHQGKS